MRFVIRIFLFGFMLLGLMTSASIANTRTQGWSLKWVLGIAAAHGVLAGFALLLAIKSKRTAAGYQIGLSPGAWIFGSSLSYLVGFVGFWMAK